MAKVRILRRPRGILEPLVRLDCDLFARVACTHTPWLDRGLPVLSRSANHSILHAASAAAFATGVAIELPRTRPPLAVLAAAVGGSRVYVGVHYPLDVLVGAGMGAGIARLTGRLWPKLPERAGDVPPSEERRLVAPNTDGAGITVVVNPSAGGTPGGDLEGMLRERLPLARVTVLEDPERLDAALATAASGSDVVGVAGGDGSVTAAATAALERSVPLLALSGGTLNHLARDLRVDGAGDALDALACGELVGVDVATIDGRPFLNSAGFGAYPEMLAHGERLRGRLGRWPGQVVALAKTLRRLAIYAPHRIGR